MNLRTPPAFSHFMLRLFAPPFFIILGGCAHQAMPPTAGTPPAPASPRLATPQEAAQAQRDLMASLGGGNLEFPRPSAAQINRLREMQAQAARWAQIALRGQATSTRPGLVVCAPRSQNRDAAFDAGCAYWLEVALGGQSTLERSPTWGTIAQAQRDLKFSSLRLEPQRATTLARAIGATHVLSAHHLSTPSGPALQWQLLTADGHAIGKPIVLAGSPVQRLTQLPRIAREVAASLHLPPPQIVPPPLTPDDLEFLGAQATIQSTKQKTPDAATVQRLQKLATREPLAAILWMYTDAIDVGHSDVWPSFVKQTLALAPDNTLLWSAIALKGGEYLKPYRADLERLVRASPRNLVLAIAQTAQSSERHDFDTQLQAALRAVGINPRSALAWEKLSDAFAAKADSIRRARFYNRLSDAEKIEIEKYYPHAFFAALQAARVAPTSAWAWHTLSVIATFNSESEIADRALWKSLALDPDDLDTWEWGLQIYQPKWFNDRARMMLVARNIAADPDRLAVLASVLSSELHFAGYEKASAATMRAATAALESRVQAQPRDVHAWQHLAYVYRQQKRYDDAVRAFESWIALEPNNVVPLIDLANWYVKNNRDPDKEPALYERAAQISPHDAIILYDWGCYYKDRARDFDKALPLLKKSMAEDKTYARPAMALGDLYWFLKNDEKIGRRYFAEAMRRAPLDGYVRAEYAWALMNHGKDTEARKYAQRALQLGETEHPVFKALGLTP